MVSVRNLLMVIIVALFGSTCTDSGTEPPSPPAVGPSSHDWTWEYTIIDPENTSGWLLDICYINDTCIWAVGKIQHHGDWYNACRWDGDEWRLMKVYDLIPDSNTEPDVHELKAVFGTAPDDIWFSGGTYFIHWDGSDFRTDHSLLKILLNANGMMQEIWGDARNNVYMGGTNGEIVHYNGHYWKRLENEIEWDIGAMHGNGDTVLVAATEQNFTGMTAFYTIVDNNIQRFYQDTTVRGVAAIWFSHLHDIYTDGPHSYQYDGSSWKLTNGWERKEKGGFGRDMSANSHYDILVCGDFCTLRHYNGIDWRQWVKLQGIASAQFNACTMRGDEAWVVGLITEGTEVVIVKGTRSAK